MCQRPNFEASIKLIGHIYNVKNRRKSARPTIIRCNDSKIGFENLYKTVLTKKRKLIKKGINHPCAKFDKVSKNRRKSELLLWGKIGLVLIVKMIEKLVAIIEAKRGRPLLKMLISKPRDAHRGM